MFRKANWLTILIMILNLSAASTIIASDDWLQPQSTASSFLPSNQAFQFEAYWEKNTLYLAWRIAPGYYLYANKVILYGIKNQQNQLVEGNEYQILTEPQWEEDPFLGQQLVFKNSLNLLFPNTSPVCTKLRVQFQGCAQAGYCYPPKGFELEIQAVNTPIKITSIPTSALYREE